ncbi:MAG: DUF2523 domain-containing protein [Inoviridae sp.]|nr:MAG: DUF2523 domain-containing protein [Inoviridae sp.]
MSDLLLLTLNQWLSTALGRLLVGAGLTLAVASGVVALFDSMLNTVITNFGNVPATVAALVNIAGVDVALSLIVSALISRQGLLAIKVFIAKI